MFQNTENYSQRFGIVQNTKKDINLFQINGEIMHKKFAK